MSKQNRTRWANASSSNRSNRKGFLVIESSIYTVLFSFSEINICFSLSIAWLLFGKKKISYFPPRILGWKKWIILQQERGRSSSNLSWLLSRYHFLLILCDRWMFFSHQTEEVERERERIHHTKKEKGPICNDDYRAFRSPLVSVWCTFWLLCYDLTLAAPHRREAFLCGAKGRDAGPVTKQASSIHCSQPGRRKRIESAGYFSDRLRVVPSFFDSIQKKKIYYIRRRYSSDNIIREHQSWRNHLFYLLCFLSI